MNIRLGLIKGLHFLCSHFQVIIFNNYTGDPTDSAYKDGADRIKTLLAHSNITIDAIYSTNMKVQGSKNLIAEDFSQIFLDFNLTTVKKVAEKVLFVSSIEIDNLGAIENMNIDGKGMFMFDFS